MNQRTHLQLVETNRIMRGEKSGPGGYADLTDEQLMLSCTHDNESAFSELMTRYEMPLRRFCAGMVTDDGLAADVAQDCFFLVWKNRRRYRNKNKFRAYLFTIARNRCINFIRRRSLLTMIGIDEIKTPLAHPAHTSSEQLEAAQMSEVLRVALGELPEKQRAAILLRFIEEMPYDEIATVMGRSTSTVRSRVHHGLKHLHVRLPREVLS